MLLLALDTATADTTVALHDGRRVVAEVAGAGVQRHAEVLAPAIVEALALAGAGRGDITEVLVGVGPGPFTGLRVGVVTARVLGGVLGVPVRGACSLDALGWDACLGRPFLAVTDARRREVYWAVYDGAGRRTGPPAVDRPAAVPVGRRPAVGAGAAAHPEAFPLSGPPLRPRAGALAEAAVAGAVELLPPDPLYLRRPDARRPGPPKPVLPPA